eukprot:TRINITY_DN1927_c0_g2_i1.p1 TRINITY_DN1927_c0_g2~~TRINITY_DN1927_c0_g2_i1.p1  ORF type:complete len:379 (-),score=87.94 TRINITY_DN1927_c0_g2_i1:103-1239(-)
MRPLPNTSCCAATMEEFSKAMATISDFGIRLERIEALLFLTDFEHFQKLDAVLKEVALQPEPESVLARDHLHSFARGGTLEEVEEEDEEDEAEEQEDRADAVPLCRIEPEASEALVDTPGECNNPPEEQEVQFDSKEQELKPVDELSKELSQELSLQLLSGLFTTERGTTSKDLRSTSPTFTGVPASAARCAEDSPAKAANQVDAGHSEDACAKRSGKETSGSGDTGDTNSKAGAKAGFKDSDGIHIRKAGDPNSTDNDGAECSGDAQTSMCRRHKAVDDTGIERDGRSHSSSCKSVKPSGSEPKCDAMAHTTNKDAVKTVHELKKTKATPPETDHPKDEQFVNLQADIQAFLASQFAKANEIIRAGQAPSSSRGSET